MQCQPQRGDIIFFEDVKSDFPSDQPLPFTHFKKKIWGSDPSPKSAS
jgi:hypothetical protein